MLPYATPDIAGTGGTLRHTPEAFEVEEIPAYAPSGEGPHTFLWIEKRGLTTQAAVDAIARALGVPPRDAGTAGLKDRHALTRQWISVPGVDPGRALGVTLPGGLRVLRAERHGNKLRTGHLRGNRFRIVIADLAVPVDEALARAGAVLAALGAGVPNYYGEQRFGADAGNADAARAFLRGRTRPPREPWRKRLLISALQSEAFNRVLAHRLSRGLLRTVLSGDVLRRSDSGGLFVSEDPARDQARLDAGEIATTGPMPGSRAMSPPAGSDADRLEREALAGFDATDGDWEAAGALAEGTRRALFVRLDEVGPGGVTPAVAAAGDRALELRFALPKGSYATALLREVQKAGRASTDEVAPPASGR